MRGSTLARSGAFALVVLLLLAAMPFGATPDVAVAALPPVNVHLNDVHFHDDQLGWVAGTAGTIMRTVNGGDDWQSLPTDTTKDFVALSFVDQNNGWALTSDVRVYSTQDGGSTWQLKPVLRHRSIDLSAPSYNPVGYDIHFVDAQTGFLVARAYPPDSGNADVLGLVYRTTDGGQSWGLPVIEGPDWKAPEDQWPVGRSILRAVDFVSPTHGWVVGIDQYMNKSVVYRTTTGGGSKSAWTEAGSGIPGTVDLYGVSFANASLGLVVGTGGAIRKSTDGGATWVAKPSGTTNRLNDVFMLDTLRAWAVGEAGTVRYTTDGGETWKTDSSVEDGAVSLRSVFLRHASSLKGWLVGAGGRVRVTTDGQNWITPIPTPPADVIRIEGTSRYDTAVAASKAAYPVDGSVQTVVIATGQNWPDALGGAALAGVLDGPILLVDTNSVPAAVLEEVGRLGAEHAIIVGGPAAVGPGVVTTLQNAQLTVEYEAGNNRYETADKVALRTIDESKKRGVYGGTAFVATGGTYADAVAAAPLSAAKGWPLFLAHPTTGLSVATKAAMADVTDVLVLGGTGAVSATTYSSIVAMPGVQTVDRLAGLSRYETAVKIAAHGVEHANLGWNRVGIATGQSYPDALAGGVLQGKMGSVMLLTRSTTLSPEPAAALTANKDAISTVTFFGGTGAVSQTVRDAVMQALE